MAYGYDGDSGREAFLAAATCLLRQSRLRQRLSQAAVAARTGGAVSKASLANYENGHRSMRIDVFWKVCRALGEDAGAMLSTAAGVSGFYGEPTDRPMSVDVTAVLTNCDPTLAPVRRWFAIRLRAEPTKTPLRAVTLDAGAIAALAQVMGVSVAECRKLLLTVSAPEGVAA